MSEQTTIKSDGTRVTDRTPPVEPKLDEPCQAIVLTTITVCEPMTDGTWRLVSAFNDNYNIILDTREPEQAKQEVILRLKEIKQEWDEKRRIVSLGDLLNTETKSS